PKIGDLAGSSLVSPPRTRSYSSINEPVTCDQLNRSSARRLAFSDSAEASHGRSWSSPSRSATAAASEGGPRKPVSPSLTVYLIPPTLLPITGRPHAIASSGVMPNGSYQGVVTKTSAAP